MYEFITALAALTSAIAAAGTLFIAYRAYKKTSNWFQQKKNEDGYNYVVALMVESDDVFAALIRLYIDVCRGEDLAYIESSVRLYSLKTLTLKRKLLACERWNINSGTEVTLYFNEMRKFCEISAMILTYLKNPDFFSGVINEHKCRLTSCKKNIERYNIQCIKSIEKMFEFPL
ncbi:hypothetical protein [Klebsiella sp. PL-2018]|uniref:hypothetical protein n=1 Tax=Klebsiella sp. PL-2018 TaxID=2851540 RepID=UPI001C232BD2|nr:hypothetical protein [Klebsiella sp. PL-2018]